MVKKTFPKIEQQFDVVEFCKRHLKIGTWAHEKTQVYTKKELLSLITRATMIFRMENTLMKMSPPCTIVGDIHGQFRDLVRILHSHHVNDFKKVERHNFKIGFASRRFVFLGDFVDRGLHSIECISLVFGLKVLYPDHYILLRGNHETKNINFAYGFKQELSTRLGVRDGHEVWESFNDAFSWMPLAALIGGRILCMHGGISPHLKSLDDIMNIHRPIIDLSTNKLALDLLWSDPIDHSNIYAVNENPMYLKNALRGLSCAFNESAVKDTCKRLNIQLIVRAHQMMENGFKFFADRKMITIFSAPRYMPEVHNKASVLKVDVTGAISISTFKATPSLKQAAENGETAEDEITRADNMDIRRANGTMAS